MLTVRVYDNYNFIVLQTLNTDHIEGCGFSTKFRDKLKKIWKSNGMCRHKIIQITKRSITVPREVHIKPPLRCAFLPLNCFFFIAQVRVTFEGDSESL